MMRSRVKALIGGLAVLLVGLFGLAAVQAAPAPLEPNPGTSSQQLQAARAEALARAAIQEQRADFGLLASDIRELRVSDLYSSRHNGLTHVYLQQYYNGIPVHGAILNVNLLPDGNVLYTGSRAIRGLREAVNTTEPVLSPVQAVSAGANAVGLEASRPLQELQARGANGEAVVSDGGFAEKPITTRLVYQPLADGRLRLAWDMLIYVADGSHWWGLRVDAVTGALLDQDDLITHENWNTSHLTDADEVSRRSNPSRLPLPAAGGEPRSLPRPASEAAGAGAGQYFVYALPKDSPNDGPRTLETEPRPQGQNASPFGWHDTDGDEEPDFTITRGNNVFAVTDLDGNNEPDPGGSPDGGPTLTFSYTIDLSQEPVNYTEAAVTNLFYWNNIMHDVTYQFGFDEPSGNFQATNYTGEGLGSDWVNADAQDGSGVANANFGTPPDGQPPRMQMFRFRPDFITATLTITSPASIAGDYFAAQAAFGPDLDSQGLSGTFVLVNDGAEPTSNACEDPLVNAAELAGNIAVIDRGTCDFTAKVLRAQQAGAIGVLLINNIPGAPAYSVGGTSNVNLMEIPTVMVSLEDGNTIRDELDGEVTGRMFRPAGTVIEPSRDGDFDNGVIAHEYGHGISNRLTGGPALAFCLQNAEQMGEGWSDWWAVTLTALESDTPTTTRGVGTYTNYQMRTENGIRPAPYTTDMSINPYTYADISAPNITIPHGLGFIWNSMLWEVYWNIVNKYGFNPDVYADWDPANPAGNGNLLAIQLVVDGMKIQPCFPAFVDGRDAILAADQVLTGGENQCEIWTGFAKRGLGYSADQGDWNTVGDETEAFDLPPACGYFGAADDSLSRAVCTADTESTVYDLIVGPLMQEPVDLAVSGVPAGAEAVLSPDPVPATPAEATLTLNNLSQVDEGSYTMEVSASDAMTEVVTSVGLEIFASVPDAPAASAPMDGAQDVSAQPTFTWSPPADTRSTSWYLEVDDSPDFSSPVLTDTTTQPSYAVHSSFYLEYDTDYYWRVRGNNLCGEGVWSPVAAFHTMLEPGSCVDSTALYPYAEEDFEDGASGWTLGDGSVGNTWALSDARTHSGGSAWHAVDPSTVSDQRLVSPPITLPSADQSPITLQFWNYQAFEFPDLDGCWDGGLLEISTDDGASWTAMPNESLLVDKYDAAVVQGSNPLSGEPAWCPNPPPQDWLKSIVGLDEYAGQTVRFRFRFGSDSAAGAEGWYIDDVSVKSCEASTAVTLDTLSTESRVAGLPYAVAALLGLTGAAFLWRRRVRHS